MTQVIELTDPYFNIFEPPEALTSTESYEFKQYREINVDVKSLSDYQIPVKDLHLFILPAASYLHVIAKVVKEDGSNLSANDVVTLTNNGFNLFSEAKYIVGDKTIEDIKYVGVGTTVSNIVDFSEDYSKTAASNMFWYPDTNDSTDLKKYKYNGTDGATKFMESQASKSTYSDFIIKNPTFNKGFQQRYSITQKSQPFGMFLPLNRLFGFCKINKVYKGVMHQIELKKNSDKNIIHRIDTTDYKVIITHLS